MSSSQTNTTRWLPRCVRAAMVLALCLSIGLQWALIQGVAWTGMLVNFSKDGSLIEAVTKTFDGNHPCPLCHAVKEGSKQEQKKSLEAPTKKFEAVFVIEVTRFFAQWHSIDYPSMTVGARPRSPFVPNVPPISQAA